MYHTYISKNKILHEQPFMLNLRLVNDNIRPQTLCRSFIEPSTGLIFLLVILPFYKHVEYLFINKMFLYLLKTQTHKLICNYEPIRVLLLYMYLQPYLTLVKEKHLGGTFPSLQLNICGIQFKGIPR